MTIAKRIIVTGDFLRPSPHKFRPTQNENIRWLAQLLNVPVTMATGLPVQEVIWDDNWLNQATFDQASVRAIYEAFWLKPNMHSWAQIYSAETLPVSVESIFAHVFRDSFVIGFELPPVLVHFLRRNGIGFVDVILSPVRFMDDLTFSVNASSPAALKAIRALALPEAVQRLAAGVVSAHVAKHFPTPPRPDTLLVIMQTSFDRAVIEGKRFVTLIDYMNELEEIAKDYSSVLVKQHPLEPQPGICDMLLRNMPDAKLTEENFYRLVSHRNLKGVAALSSSCVYEAGFFGKRQHALMPSVNFSKSPAGLDLCEVGDILLVPDFWRDALGASGLAVSAKDGITLPPKPNRFRLQHHTSWGYNEIDTDIAVAWAKD